MRTTNGYGPQTDFGRIMHAMKYRGPEETFDDYCVRYARTVADTEPEFRRLIRLLREQVVLPAGRQQLAVGRPHQTTAFNCFVGDTIDDSTDAIFDAVKAGAMTLRSGGGVGWDFSTLRPNGDPVRGLGHGAKSSGPVSFMHVWHAMCSTIMSAGERRGAMMGCLRIDHPDVLTFVRAKQDQRSLTNFNISLLVTDEFMEALAADALFTPKFGGVSYAPMRAHDVWGPIMESNWDHAEPGVLFVDRINRLNPLNYCETISATNPCFEAGTLIVTSKGAFPIEDLVGKTVSVHDGRKWRKIDSFRITGHHQPMIKIGLQDGSEIRVTEAHTMVLADGSKKKARELTVNDSLKLNTPQYDGELKEKAAYLKGFLIGDGSPKMDRSTLWLYEPKWGCSERLIRSHKELGHGPVRTSAVEKAEFRPVRDGVLTMTGLAPHKEDLVQWTNEYKHGLPVKVFAWDAKSKRDFIAGFFDADGSTRDSKANGFGYQVTSVSRKLLIDVQILLKTMGVRSKLGVLHYAAKREIKGVEYECQQSWRLSLPQADSISLSKMVKFSRLSSFANREIKRDFSSQAGKIISITSDGVDETVYCCTVPKTNTLTLGIGIVTGNCAEQPLPPNGACLLGSVNVLKLLTPAHEANGPMLAAESGRQTVRYIIDYELLNDAVDAMVRAFDNVIDRTTYPLQAQKAEALAKRRMGVGVTGMANALEVMGFVYGTASYIEAQGRVLDAVLQQSYRTSMELAREKGPFPLWDADKYCSGEFFNKAIRPDLRELIRRGGLRNGLLTSIAPTGTISLTADNVSSGIEPVFQHRYERDILTPDGKQTFEVIDAAFNQYAVRGRAADEVTAEEHIDVLCGAQGFVDSSISKTCNVAGQIGGEGPGMTYRDFVKLYTRAYEGGSKGCTTFNIHGKRMGILRKTEADDPGGLACTFDPVTGERSCEV